MNRRSITPTTIAALAVLAAALLRPAHAADAPPAPAPAAANDVATIAAGLEAPDAATRAKAAETLGARYPEAAVALPVLLEATRDDDATVRAAALRAVRLLGRRGQEDAAKAWAAAPAADLAAMHEAFRFIFTIGQALTPTDIAHLILEAAAAKSPLPPVALHLFTLCPVRLRDGELEYRIALRDALGPIEVVLPFVASKDPATARAAAAAATILGRSAVAAPFGAAPEDDTASAPQLAAMLSAEAPAVRFAGWRLVANGAPHSFRTAMTLVKLAAALPKDNRGLGDEPPDFAVERDDVEAAARSLGTPASTFLTEGRAATGEEDDRTVRTWLEVGAKNLVRDVWRAAMAEWVGPRHRRQVSLRLVLAIGEDTELASMAAKSLPRLVDTERSESESSRALLQPVDPNAPADPVPQDTAEEAPEEPWRRQPHRCLALAWLAHRVPEAEVDKGMRARAAGALRRALVAADRIPDRMTAAAILVDLGKPGLVPPATLLASLQASRTKESAPTELNLLAALAVGPVPDEAIARLAPIATVTQPAPAIPPNSRGPIATDAPFFQPAMAMENGGAFFEFPVLRRLAAIDALGAVTGDKAKAKEVLVPLTKDADARVRYRAAKALRRLGA
ncbi:MAG: hypothetical protein JNM10_19760 [Planctomycetia bacterium]|nr:hypothetical protein [Planctomycetia bacterium]